MKYTISPPVVAQPTVIYAFDIIFIYINILKKLINDLTRLSNIIPRNSHFLTLQSF